MSSFLSRIFKGKKKEVEESTGGSGGAAPRLPLASSSAASSSSSASSVSSEPAVPIAVAPSTPEEFYSTLTYTAKLKVTDFEILKTLGKGAFGTVKLVKKNKASETFKGDTSNKLYALKSLKKAELVRTNQLEHTATERHVLEKIRCPFLVHLAYAFQTTDKLYMVLDYMRGGEIFFWLQKQQRFSEARSRLYAAELVLAIEAMHAANIIHRDLKPENILYVSNQKKCSLLLHAK